MFTQLISLLKHIVYYLYLISQKLSLYLYYYFFSVNSFGVHHIQFEEFEKKGKKYYKALNYNLSMDAEKFIFLLENLFGGEKALGDAMNKLLNENGRDLFLDVRKGYEDSFSIIFKELTNNIFTKIPLNEIFIFNE